MQRLLLKIEICLAILGCVMGGSVAGTWASDGPLGLHWGMPKEAVEKLGIHLCCRQVGKWGARYQVNADDFQRFPNSLGDEEKVYLYFGNTNKLLRVYSAIRKVDGWNRYKQINVILNKKYTFSESCRRKKYDKYEALKKGKTEETCKEYDAYATYKKDAVEVLVGLERFGVDYRISLIFVHGEIYEIDKDKKNPL